MRRVQGALRRASDNLSANLANEGHRVGLWLVVALGTGIAVYFALPVEPSVWVPAFVFAVASAAWLYARPRDAAYAALFLAVAAMALGCAAARTRAIMAGSPILGEPIRSAGLEGRIVSIEPAPARDGRPLGPRVVLDRVGIEGVATPPERVRIRLRPIKDGESALSPGQRIALRASLMPPPSPAAPGAYDFGRQAFFQGIGGVGFAFVPPRVVDAPVSAGRAQDGWIGAASLWIGQLHTALDRRIREALPGPSGAMASALLTGEHGAIPQDVNDAMRDSGLAHLLAISGMNLSLVIGFLFVGARALLAAVPWIALRWPIKKLAVMRGPEGCSICSSPAPRSRPSARS